MTPPPPSTGRREAATLAAAALGTAKLPLLVVRRSRRFAGLNLLFGSLGFGFGVSALWYAIETGESLAMPLVLLLAVTFYGVQAGRQFRDDTPKLLVERAGLMLPGILEGPIAWSDITDLALATGLRAIGGGHIHVGLDSATFARIKLGHRWAGDIVIKGKGVGTAVLILGAPLDTDTRTIFAAMRRYWPVGG